MIDRALPLLVLLLALSSCAQGEQRVVRQDGPPVRVSASVERADVTPGKPFELVVEVQRLRGTEFTLPDVGAGIQGLVLMKTHTEGPEIIGDHEIMRYIYKLKAPKSGTYLIPGVEAPWKSAELKVGTAGSGPILIEAGRPPGEEGAGEEELRDLKPLQEPDVDRRPLILAGAVAVLIGLIVVLLLWKLSKRQQAPIQQAPPDVIARDALRALRGSGRLRAADQQGPIAYEISAILRRYLEQRFCFPAWRMTTQEVLRAMPDELSDRRDVEARIRQVLEASDLVKFARQPVSSESLNQWVDDALFVVDTTADPGAALDAEEGDAA